MAIRYPIVPNNITIHLGEPDEAANDVTVPFQQYISNVVSNEIYPTWPKNAIIANTYAVISFTLNRIYNEWYKSKGYNFDITSSPKYDQTYIHLKATYENIDDIVGEIFNNYIFREGQVQPLYATYCDGRVKTCEGLSQWGSVGLANQGKTPLEILKYYYGNDINIKYNAPVGDNTFGYPGYEIGPNSVGNPVLAIQRDLKRIRLNYPAIPSIQNNLGIYDESTKKAVEKFQEVFSLPVTGIVDKATWYKIKYIYTSVKKLSDISSEGLSPAEATFLYSDELKYGDSGIDVEYIHYFLNVIAFLDNDIPLLKTNSVYTTNTETMVKAFQSKYGLPVTGNFTYQDYVVLMSVYDDIIKNLPDNDYYPDYFLVKGMSGDDVRRIQNYLLLICRYDKSIPGVKVNSIFDDLTEKSIKKIQKDYGFEVNGIVGPLLWKKLVELSKR